MSVCQAVPIVYFISIIFKSTMTWVLVHGIIKLLMLLGGNKYIAYIILFEYFTFVMQSKNINNGNNVV